MMKSYKANTVEAVQKDVVSNVEYMLACTRFNFTKEDAYRVAASSNPSTTPTPSMRSRREAWLLPLGGVPP